MTVKQRFPYDLLNLEDWCGSGTDSDLFRLTVVYREQIELRKSKSAVL